MSPRYENSPANVRAGIEVFPKDDYEFIFGEPKPFHGVTKSGKNEGKENYGMMFSLTVGDGPYKGKRQVLRLFENTEESQGMGKQVKMAALGYNKGKQEEERFDEEWGAKDWSFDTDTGAVGDAWREMTGQRAIASLDISINKDTGDEQQAWKGWRTLNAPDKK